MIAVTALVLLTLNLRFLFGSTSALLPELSGHFALSATQMGLLTTAPVLALGFFGPLAPKLAKRWSVTRILAGCLAIIAVGSALRAVDSWPIVVLGVLLGGAAIAVGNVLGPIFVRLFFPNRLGLMTGLLTGLVSAGAGIASGIAVPLATGLGTWQRSLAGFALPAAIAVVVFLALRRPHRPEPVTQTPQPVAVVFHKHRATWGITLFMGLQSLLAYCFIGWLPTLLRDGGMAAGSAGLALTVLSIVSIASALIVPVVADRTGNYAAIAVAMVALSIVGILGLLLFPVNWAFGFAVALGLGQGGELSLALLLVNVKTADVATATTMSTIVQSTGYIIAGIGPLLVGLLQQLSGGWDVPLYVLLALMVPLLIAGIVAGKAPIVGASPRQSA